MKTLTQQFNDVLKETNKLKIMEECNEISNVVKVVCSRCNKEFKMKAYEALQSTHRCKVGKYTQEQIEEMIKERGLDITIIGRFISASSSTKVRCNRCGKIWSTPPRYLAVDSNHVCK